MSLLAKQLAIKGEVRYMADNILKLDLDMPIRTTRDYTGPTVSASVQAVLDRAIQSEEEITIDARYNMEELTL
jgi:kinesin family protein 3/17